MYGHVRGTDHLNLHQITTNRRNEFRDVVGRHHDGPQRRGFLFKVIGSNASSKAGEDHHQAGDKSALRLSAHGPRFHINYLIKTNN